MDVASFTAGITFFMANFFVMLVRKFQIMTMNLQSDFSSVDFYGLDGPYLRLWWVHRRELAYYTVTGGFFQAISWALFLIPIFQVIYIMSNGGKRKMWLHTTMGCLALSGCITQLVSRLIRMGVYNTANWINMQFNVRDWGTRSDGERDWYGIKVLEMVYQIAGDMTQWSEACTYLILFGIFVLNFISVRTLNAELYQTLGIRLAGLGLFIAMLCFIDAMFLMLRWQDWNFFTQLASSLTVINRVFLIPIWVIILSFRLPGALSLMEEQQRAVEEALKAPPQEQNDDGAVRLVSEI